MLDKFYGEDNSGKKDGLWVGVFFLSLAIIFTIIFIFYVHNHDALTLVFSLYINSVFWAGGLFAISFYFFCEYSSRKKFKAIKYTFVIISLVLLAIIFLPFTILQLISDKTKLINIPRYLSVYLIIYTMNLLLSYFIFLGIIMLAHIYSNKYIGILSLAIITTYLFSTIISYGCLKIYFYHKCKKQSKYCENEGKLSYLSAKIKVDYKQCKKEMYIFRYLAIVVLSFMLYILEFSDNTVKGIQNNIICAFTLFIILDTIKDKWVNVFKKSDDPRIVFLQNISKDLDIIIYQIDSYKLLNYGNLNIKINLSYSKSEIDIIMNQKPTSDKKYINIYEKLIFITNNKINVKEIKNYIEQVKVEICALI